MTQLFTDSIPLSINFMTQVMHTYMWLQMSLRSSKSQLLQCILTSSLLYQVLKIATATDVYPLVTKVKKFDMYNTIISFTISKEAIYTELRAKRSAVVLSVNTASVHPIAHLKPNCTSAALRNSSQIKEVHFKTL